MQFTIRWFDCHEVEAIERVCGWLSENDLSNKVHDLMVERDEELKNNSYKLSEFWVDFWSCDVNTIRKFFIEHNKELENNAHKLSATWVDFWRK